MKKCTKCEQEKDLSLFPNDTRMRSGKHSWCKSCFHKYMKKYATKAQRKKDTGYTEEDYIAQFNKQKGCCAICGKHHAKLKRALDADHCHKTGTKRGLLCSSCNVGLGYFKDDIDLLKKAVKYLKDSLKC